MSAKQRAQIAIIRRQLQNIPTEFVDELNKIDFVALLEKTHKKQQNPYQNKWASRKNPYNHPILNKSGRLLKGYVQTKHSEGVVVKNKVPYAIYHQIGAGKLKVRLLIPTTELGLPKHWYKIIEKAWNDFIKQKNKKR